MPTNWPSARDLMTARPVTIPNDAPVSRALGLMGSRGIHELPVLRKKALIGMVTLESIARRTNLPLNTKVEHLMVLPPLITEGTPYPELAERLLAAGLRAAPVVGRRNELVGVVSRTDLVRAFPRLTAITHHKVGGIATPVGLILNESDAVETMLSHIRLIEEHPLPVVDRKGRLVGAVGVADLSRVFWKPKGAGKGDAVRHDTRERHVFQVAIGAIMHSPAVTVEADTDAGSTAKIISDQHVSSAFVIEDGKPVGVVTQGDLIGLAVGEGAPPAGGRTGGSSDVYVQITGLRGGDPETLAEIDQVVAQGLRRISRHVRPQLLALHVAPHATHRSGDATVQARLHTDRGIFYASDTEWNYFAGIATLMDELGEQVRRAKEEQSERRHRGGSPAMNEDETVGSPELEEQLREAAEPAPDRARTRRRR
jgi:CBS-domain-containing membrane protein/ribosome-associated translation inhibitor RaiA